MLIVPRRIYFPVSETLQESFCVKQRLIKFIALAESSAVKYETRTFPVALEGNPFIGDPRPELESAWHELFEGTEILRVK